jgi:hypothetical protein
MAAITRLLRLLPVDLLRSETLVFPVIAPIRPVQHGQMARPIAPLRRKHCRADAQIAAKNPARGHKEDMLWGNPA